MNRAATSFPPTLSLFGRGACLLVGWVLAVVACQAHAQAHAQARDDDLGSPGIAEAADAAARADSPGSGIARITSEVTAVHTRLAPAAAAPLAPNGRPLTDLAGVDYRLWMSHGRADLGVGVGTIGYVQPAPDGRIAGPVSLVGSTPTVSLAVRYRMTRHAAVYAGATGARGLGVDTGNDYVSTKVGLEWKPAKQTFGFDHGAFGMHLDSGYHLSLKARHGGLGVYLRGKF